MKNTPPPQALKQCLAFAALAAFCSVPAFAQEVAVPAPANDSGWNHSVGIELFYGTPTDDLADGAGEKVEIGGFNVRYTVKAESLLKSDAFVPEFFAIAGFGYGEYDETSYYTSYYHSYSEKIEADVSQAQLAVGANLRWQATESFSAFVGARVGLGYLSVDATAKLDGSKYFDDDDSDVGFLYGVGVGVEYAFNEHHAVTLGYDFVGSTAEPKVSDGSYGFKAEEQNYHMFSVGYKYTF